MEIRKARKEDLEQIRNIYAQWYTDESTGKPSEEDISYFTKKIEDAISKTEASLQSDYYCLVAENEKGKIIGILGLRKPHHKLLPFTTTTNAMEIYSLFALERNMGVGRALVHTLKNTAAIKKYKEIIVLSANRWKESWPFYDALSFERIGTLAESNGKYSQLWHILI
jgi:L-amino acid N-acyltransferase YncA